jgi:thiamine-monophosphate kinase
VKGARARPSLARLGENGLLRLLTARWPRKGKGLDVGVGDDCAVLRAGGKVVLFKTDCVVEGVHFRADAPPGLIGRKALARGLSDIAAMGGVPLAAVVTLGLPADESPRRLEAIYRGLEAMARRHGVLLVGGETTRAAQLFLNVALLGECPDGPPVLRSGARAGDLLFVTGRLGATQARKHLAFEPRLEEGRWLARHRAATAMMDLSDGLGADLPRLAAASRLGVELDEHAIPRRPGASRQAALNDGEDYELLFTVRPARAKWLKKKWPFATALHCIGSMRKDGPTARGHGFDHFKQRRGRAGVRRAMGG